MTKKKSVKAKVKAVKAGKRLKQPPNKVERPKKEKRRSLSVGEWLKLIFS
jgi:hypothetical protein